MSPSRRRHDGQPPAEDHLVGPRGIAVSTSGAGDAFVDVDSADTTGTYWRRTSSGDQSSRWVFGTPPPPVESFRHRRVADDLARRAGLRSRSNPTTARPLTLSGRSGVGKTQLAAEYARGLLASDGIDILMWVDASSRDAILSIFSQAVAVMGSTRHTDTEGVVGRWWEWLSSSGKRWLVVLDDLHNPSDMNGLWPPHAPGGQVLVTSRRHQDDGDHVIEVGVFTPAESAAFLAGRLAERPAQAVGAPELAEELGHLPLALAQAAAHMADRIALTCASYRQRWLGRHRELPGARAGGAKNPDDHHATMATTTSLSADLADSLHPVGLARPLLELASVLDANGFPGSVLASPAVLAALSAAAGRKVDVTTTADALACLHRLGLITYRPDVPHRAVRVHPFVQHTVRGTLAPDRAAARAHTMTDALMQTWPEAERDPELSAVMRNNVNAMHNATNGLLWESSARQVLFRAGESAGVAGHVRYAIDYYTALCGAAARQLGPDHPDTLQARHNLAHWRGEAGDAPGMTAAMEQVLTDIERVLGVNHPSALTTRHNLAYSQGEDGDAAGAVDALERVLDAQTRLLGSDSQDTLTTHLSLARWLGETGDVSRAVDEFEQVLATFERVLGIDHPDTLTARQGLARWLGETGDVRRAIVELEQVLADQHRTLGADHPETLATRHNLAYWRTEVGDAAGAVAELNEVLAGQQRVLGPDHPDTLTTRHNLAYSQGESGAADEAAEALVGIVAAQERVLGPGHPRTQISRQSLTHWRKRTDSRRDEAPPAP
ncbi:FxSxx-COOH system tetratricopeptide repeat protein [Umezawaea sp. Da 62-37]|uniref:FxSxx-COOH system tetratricopeptide repeat protein n=1 Tax=Umezawaea sp. Da 62-37 TaxID=3075927 RepID=UPI0028F6D758|nr:FxSxx-COOH system tetratricopeptide repeat protein [Umezawaea sp. Da 62-37]WNV83927.1 FxSxx-COOH system tetratricopeptide repeat protein [Umezawaea sp. Da 62-37]